MFLPVAAVVGATALFCVSVAIWFTVAKPALWRRYERAHHRRKARGSF
jgi:hypothetical protein